MRGSLLLPWLLIAACSVDVSLGDLPQDELGQDAEPADVGTPDGGAPDTGRIDAGTPDAGSMDTGVDSGVLDGGPVSHDMLILSAPQVMCDEAMVGRESDFESASPGALGLSGGEILVEAPTSSTGVYRVSGAPFLNSFGLDTLLLRNDVPDAPPEFYFQDFPLTGGGPLDTVRLSGMFTINAVPVHDHLEAQLGVALGTDLTTGYCLVVYLANLTPQ